mmetsp:Transcript_86371/g.241703  ORF Transcript_86371/g.241703 Transcript_86371/m.241703 type:complete len:221 (-) Transcript_86371:432-1094(-)
MRKTTRQPHSIDMQCPCLSAVNSSRRSLVACLVRFTLCESCITICRTRRSRKNLSATASDSKQSEKEERGSDASNCSCTVFAPSSAASDEKRRRGPITFLKGSLCETSSASKNTNSQVPTRPSQSPGSHSATKPAPIRTSGPSSAKGAGPKSSAPPKSSAGGAPFRCVASALATAASSRACSFTASSAEADVRAFAAAFCAPSRCFFAASASCASCSNSR